jgi:hypothetical protein
MNLNLNNFERSIYSKHSEIVLQCIIIITYWLVVSGIVLLALMNAWY